MILPRPRVHCTGLDDIYFKLRDDGAHQITPNPETPQAYATHSNFGFSRTPKQKDPKGFRVAYICGDSGGLVNSGRPSP